MTWLLHTQGNCVWGAGQTGDMPVDGISGTPDEACSESMGCVDDVQSLNGSVGQDFTISGEIVWLGPIGSFAPVERYSPLRMVIEFGDAGEVLLREDREAGVGGPRCPYPQGFCPDPLVLQRAD